MYAFFISHPAREASEDLNDLNDSVHDDENIDVPHPGPYDPAKDKIVARQVERWVSSLHQASCFELVPIVAITIESTRPDFYSR